MDRIQRNLDLYMKANGLAGNGNGSGVRKKRVAVFLFVFSSRAYRFLRSLTAPELLATNELTKI